MIEIDALAITIADHLNELGGVPEHRVRTRPAIGKAGLSDFFTGLDMGLEREA